MSKGIFNADQFLSELGFYLGQFQDCFTSDFTNIDQSEWKNNMSRLANLNMNLIYQRAIQKVILIEQCFQENAKLLLLDSDNYGSNSDYYISKVFHENCLVNLISSDINQLISQYSDLQISAANLLSFVNNNSGISGLLRGIFIGNANPVDGLAHLTGNGSTQVTQNELQKRFSANAHTFANSVGITTQSLKSHVLNLWNEGSYFLVEKT